MGRGYASVSKELTNPECHAIVVSMTKPVAQPTNSIFTTRVRTVIRTVVSGGVGLVASYFYSRWAHFNTGQFAGVALAVASLYHAGVQWAETKFPRLGWLLGILLQPKAPVTPVTPAVGSKAVK